MKKLKNKVFWVLFLILTIFLISILVIFNYQNYQHEKKEIVNNLNAMSVEKKPLNMDKPQEVENQELQGNDIEPSKEFEPKKENADSYKRIFMNLNVYTVLLDENNNIIDIDSHTEEETNEDEISDIATFIIYNHNEENMYVGNLYYDDYSYSFKDKSEITIIDNTRAKDRLISLLKTSALIWGVLELGIIYLSIRLTKWIIKPVIESFNKQKQFIADASHELKTPLSVILASSEALEKDYEEKWVNNIKSESERMNKLISNLLDLAKLEETGAKEQYNKNNLSKTVEMSALTFEGLMYEKNIKLNCNIQENIIFNCNNEQIKQLLAILLDNAIKHSSKEGEIAVILKKNKNDITLDVKNKGEGIPKGAEEKIFERFYRVDESRNRNENRYGLGLAIAKNIVTNHGGKIFAFSQNGETTFRVEFK